jgi:hypothetical protein
MKTNPNDIIHQTFSQDMAGGIHFGLTKREHFAALAFQGIMASGEFYSSGSDMAYAAKSAVLAADILIETLNAEDKPRSLENPGDPVLPSRGEN